MIARQGQTVDSRRDGIAVTLETFDYIVVGAGSAGCVVAARLSESGRHSVLVLEAGGRDSNPWIHIPMGYGKTYADEAVNWCFSMEPSPELNGRRLYSPCGKVLGGSSSINGLVYLRGHREDFESWREDGNEGWGYDDVLPFYRKSEDQQHGENAFHAVGGPLSVSDQTDVHPICGAFVDSAVATGFKRNPDFNGACLEGVGAFQMTCRNGRRISSAVAFLRDAEQRPNVSLRTRAEVEQLAIESGRVTGVTYVRGNTSFAAKARRAVILCAGALNSPAILQRSGIGRAEWLQEVGIKVTHELSGVGANLHDHLQARLVIRNRRHRTLNTVMRNPLRKMLMGVQYALFRRGPLTCAGGQTGGIVRSHPELDRPDTMFFVMPFSSVDYRQGLDPFSGFTIASCLQRPQSRGTLRVRSPNPKEAPLIQPNFLNQESDRRAMVNGLRLARRIVATDPLRQQIEGEERPGPAVNSDDELLSYIRATASSVYHPAGTCKMGCGPDAVVDSKLRVRGVDGLVVADASIMPTIVSTSPNATAIMIGERAAAFLLENP